MTRLHVLAVALIALSVTILVCPSAQALPVFFGANAYEFVDASLSWTDAEAAAEALEFGGVSGHLVTIESGGENAFVLSLVGGTSNHFAWIGGSDAASEGVWSWVTGEVFWLGAAAGTPVLYSNWSPGQPDDFEDIQEYAVLIINPFFPAFQSPGQWDDIPLCCAESFVVEFEAPQIVPEPTSVMLLGTGLVWLLRKKLRARG